VPAPLPTPQRVRLAEILGSLSLATDLGTGVPLEEALRSCLLATRLAARLGLARAEVQATYYVALLRYAGCTAAAHAIAPILGDEIASGAWFATVDAGDPRAVIAAILGHVGAGEPLPRRAGAVVRVLASAPQLREAQVAHCEAASLLAGRFGLDEAVQLALLHSFERWDGKGTPGRVRAERLAFPARVVQVAHDAAVFARVYDPAAAAAMVRRRAGAAYDPAVAAAFAETAPTLFGKDDAEPWSGVLNAEPEPRRWLAGAAVDAACCAIADFADLKSPFLIGHSRAVADLAAAAASRYRPVPLDEGSARRAAWIHDVGRAAVSSAIWDAPRPLHSEEWEAVRLHSYYTERVFARSPLLAPLATLASQHHERLDGSGYHRGAHAPALPLLARLLAAADVYSALRASRPYRAAFGADEAATIVHREASAGRLDAEAAELVLGAAGHRAARVAKRPADLSDAEVGVLRLVARGLTNRAVAGRLHLSPRTVGNHLQHVYEKAGLSTRAAATLFALQHGLLDEGAAPEDRVK
jgi:HD-GYP domain-containing protein (c-di-GMP phosphodiesterase class II)